MQRQKQGRGTGIALAAFHLLAILLLLTGARADEPMLAVYLNGGEGATYNLSDIDWAGFEGEETFAVVTGDIWNYYDLALIERIEFLWDASNVEDPMNAAALVDVIHLFQNQPNPFSPDTRISYELPRAGEVELGIYSVSGRLIRALVSETSKAGRYTVAWDGLDGAGRAVPSGVYFYNLRAPGIEESRRMILLP
ncbi:MAG: T9SS type A sorting domain-containing protein [Candidatus Eisenbacteria bacterium]|uniref:T9SS type A sorting domain-containing protein n=1 Tax=Eiseniibacteriota bacterium TaxID=2212470 RepID=A0A948RQS6_UNCEI|nr:T9SS type A sorting domain-containing protein [Candidatus Eisenbacteria bacterium]MBU2689313.1 T9SS type A sorting domain-containing protein [Candidatus Eisenbacteria bacterium]